jgi:Flp pilus assembly protein TadG
MRRRVLARGWAQARAARLVVARDAVTVVEFAILAPVFLTLLLGSLDIGQMAYGKAVLNGAVERAARSSSLESADTVLVDKMVKDSIKPIFPNATIATERKSYFDFADVDRPEKFSDLNNNGTCNAGEPYVDENRSGSWEPNVGRTGNGGSGDVVLYTVTVTYKPLFTAAFMGAWNWKSTRTLTAVGVRKNQPFANQGVYGSSAGTCS